MTEPKTPEKESSSPPEPRTEVEMPQLVLEKNAFEEDDFESSKYVVCAPGDGSPPWIERFENRGEMLSFIREQLSADDETRLFPFEGKRFFFSEDNKFLFCPDKSCVPLENGEPVRINRMDEPIEKEMPEEIPDEAEFSDSSDDIFADHEPHSVSFFDEDDS